MDGMKCQVGINPAWEGKSHRERVEFEVQSVIGGKNTQVAIDQILIAGAIQQMEEERPIHAEIKRLRKNKPLVYLACPYSHPDPAVREGRFRLVNRAAGDLMKKGMKVFSPITHSHPIEVAGGEAPQDWEFWEQYDRAFIEHSNKIVVLKLMGWEHSKGVTAEIAIAQELGIPVEYLEPTPGSEEDTWMGPESGFQLKEVPTPIGQDIDELYKEAVRAVIAHGQASSTILQRRLRIGYGRAARLLDVLEQNGIVGPHRGSEPRQVLKKEMPS